MDDFYIQRMTCISSIENGLRWTELAILTQLSHVKASKRRLLLLAGQIPGTVATQVSVVLTHSKSVVLAT